MRRNNARFSRSTFFVLTVTMLAIAACAALFAVINGSQNPRARFWGDVREGVVGYTAVASEAHQTLIHNGGQNWRQLRNGVIAGISPWVLAGVPGAIMVFFIIFGQDKLEEGRSGILIRRFDLWERILHWTTAALFIVLAVTGLSNLFGRAVLIPLIGQSDFAGYMQWALWTHNVCGPLFVICLLVEFVAWVKYNIPKKLDVEWFKNMGGMVGKGPRPHAEKINGGEKAWFWLMAFSGIGVGITGVLMDFPVWGQERWILQISHIIHAAVGVLFVAASLGHIYIGTIGAEGASDGMWKGSVDAAWAKQHADLWYEQEMKHQGMTYY